MKTQQTSISIWRNAIGYVYCDDFDYKSKLLMIEAVGMLIARLAATIQHSEDVEETVEYQIDITKRTYSD